jgi:hypothetical protein
MRFLFATQTANTSPAVTSVTKILSRGPYIGDTRDVLSLTHIGLGWVGAARGETPLGNQQPTMANLQSVTGRSN